MRILIVAARYLPFMGGIESHVREIAVRLASKGHLVTILTTDPSGRLPPSEQNGDVQIVRVRAWPKHRDYYFAPQVISRILGGSWDVIHIQGYHTFVPPLAMAAAIHSKVPFVLTFHSGGHSSDWRNSIRRLQHTLLAPLVRRAAQLIAVSGFEAQHFSRSMNIPLENFAVVPNGAQLIEGNERQRIAEGPPLIVSIGRLERYKGHHRVIEAIPDVLKQMPGARLRVLGEGPYKDHLISLVARMGLQDHVEIGGIPMERRAEMTALLSQAALAVLLSDYEAHPIAVMEAISLKVPVLVTDCTGLSEIAKQGYATAIPLSSDASAIAKSIVEIIHSPPAVAGLQLPDWDECANRLLDIYKKVQSHPGGTRSEACAGQVIQMKP